MFCFEVEAIYYSFPIKQQVMNPIEKSLEEFFSL